MARPLPQSCFMSTSSSQTTPTSCCISLFLSFLTSLSSTLAWKITDVDFASAIGTKHLCTAYLIIAFFLVASGLIFAHVRNKRSAERIFIRIQQISWSTFLLLGLFEMQYNISSTSFGIFALKILGHVYSSSTLLSFWIMYDPYDPHCRISKTSYTYLLTCGYIGIAVSGIVCNELIVNGAKVCIPLIGFLSFAIWFFANVCHPRAMQKARVVPILKDIGSSSGSSNQTHYFNTQTKESLQPKNTRFSRSTLFLILGSILLNTLAGSTEFTIIANFEKNLASFPQIPSSYLVGSFLTLFGLGNVLALISTTVWYSVRLTPFGLMCAGFITLLCTTVFAISNTALSAVDQANTPQSITGAIATLLVVESLYPIVVQSNMMNVLSALPISTQRQARALIESFAEAIGLVVMTLFLETSYISTTSFEFILGVCCFALCALSAFLHLRQKGQMQSEDLSSQFSMASIDIKTQEDIPSIDLNLSKIVPNNEFALCSYIETYEEDAILLEHHEDPLQEDDALYATIPSFVYSPPLHAMTA